jgi:hypothetical protein
MTRICLSQIVFHALAIVNDVAYTHGHTFALLSHNVCISDLNCSLEDCSSLKAESGLAFQRSDAFYEDKYFITLFRNTATDPILNQPNSHHILKTYTFTNIPLLRLGLTSNYFPFFTLQF